jgi:hypothetical protein
MNLIEQLRQRIAARMNKQTAELPTIQPGQLPRIRSVGFSIDNQDRFVVEVALRRDYQEVPDSGMVVIALRYATPEYTEVAWYHGRFGDIPENDAYPGRKATIYMDPDLVEQAHEGKPEVVVSFGVAGNDYYDLEKRVTERFHRKARKYLLQPRDPGEIPPMLPLPEPDEKPARDETPGHVPTVKSRSVTVYAGHGQLFNFEFEDVPYWFQSDGALSFAPNNRYPYIGFVRPALFEEGSTGVFIENPTNSEVEVEVFWLELE